MIEKIKFGWRVPDFPENYPNSPVLRANQFRQQIITFMDAIHGGLNSVWVGDHFLPWPAEIDQSLDTIEAWTTLSYLAGRYPEMTFGTIVLSQGYRPPALLAKMSANLQWMTGGKHVLGLGAGWKENEYKAYGYDYPSDKIRLEQLEEAIQVILAMWTEDCPDFDGKYYHIKGACLAPRPNPLPPLLIGGMGPRVTLRIVAQFADWCNLNNVDTKFCQERLDILRAHCQTVGRNYDEIVKTYSCDCVALGRTHEEAETIHQASFFAPFAPMVGTSTDIVDKLKGFVDLGITHFILRFVDFPRTDGVKRFIQEVMPRFE